MFVHRALSQNISFWLYWAEENRFVKLPPYLPYAILYSDCDYVGSLVHMYEYQN